MDAKKKNKMAMIFGVILILVLAGANWYYMVELKKAKEALAKIPTQYQNAGAPKDTNETPDRTADDTSGSMA